MDIDDDDIQFDFFEDEPATTESSGSRVRLPRRQSGQAGRPRRRPAGPPRGGAPLLRLVLMVVFVVFLVLLFGLLVQSCASQSRHDAYTHYMTKVSAIANQSVTNGKSVASILTTTGLSVTQIESKLRGVAQAEQQNVLAAEHVNPPGRLRDVNMHLIEALELRVSGTNGLADTFQSTAKNQTSTDSTLLATEAERLLASDVVWDDLFKGPAIAQFQHDGVSGVNVPESHFVGSADLVSEKSMGLVLQRIRGASTGGTPTGVHGTNIVDVKAEPGDHVLAAGTTNTVTATTTLAFTVDVADSGDSQEVQIAVTLTIDRSSADGGPIVKTQTIDVINPAQTVPVTFTDLGRVPFAAATTVRVDVATVPGEKNKANNSAQYPVIFSLP
jgi:hypothetical protein